MVFRDVFPRFIFILMFTLQVIQVLHRGGGGGVHPYKPSVWPSCISLLYYTKLPLSLSLSLSVRPCFSQVLCCNRPPAPETPSSPTSPFSQPFSVALKEYRGEKGQMIRWIRYRRTRGAQDLMSKVGEGGAGGVFVRQREGKG